MVSNRKFFFRSLTIFLLMGLIPFVAGCGGGSSPAADNSFRPVVFVHGFSGSASQFESQAQRFIANGYPPEYLAVYEHDTGTGAPAPENQTDGLDEIIDALLQATGQDRVDLIGHSRGTRLSQAYLSTSERAAKVAHYVNVDGFPADALPGGVPTLALWADGWLPAGPPADPYARLIVGATNVYLLDQSHIQICTSAESFLEIFNFFNGRNPTTTNIPAATGNTVKMEGRVLYFPQNTGAVGTLEIFKIHPVTAQRIGGATASLAIDSTGNWGPVDVEKGSTYEFAFQHTTGSKHYFYREPFMTDNYFVRLNTSNPLSPTGLGNFLTKTGNHTNILISRDKEMWGDQQEENDLILVDGWSVLTEQAGARMKHLSGLFLLDWGPVAPDNGLPNISPFNNIAYYEAHVLGATDLSAPIAFFHAITFMSGLDIHIPASSPTNRAVAVWMIPRGGGGKIQYVNVPNWPSNNVRISVHFRDFVQ